MWGASGDRDVGKVRLVCVVRLLALRLLRNLPSKSQGAASVQVLVSGNDKQILNEV